MIRIGLISDTHIPEAGESLPEQIWAALRGTDFIIHAGDLHIIDVLNWLEEIAPVKAVRGNGDDGMGGRSRLADDPRLLPVHVLDVDGFRIGVAHGVPLPDEAPWISLERTMDRLFDGPVDVIVFGDTHVDYVKQHDDVLLVNPGSPTLPYNLIGHLGTVGILEIGNGDVNAEIIPLGKWPVR